MTYTISETMDKKILLEDSYHAIPGNAASIALYQAWKKPEKAEEWRAKLPQTKAAATLLKSDAD